MRSFRASISVWACLVVLIACEKVPLREITPEFDLASAHWFENEKTQYVFFSVGGLRAGQAKLDGTTVFEMSVDGGKFQPLDSQLSVHRHHITECGDGRLCGSYSFHAEKPSDGVQIRMRYHPDSPLGVVRQIANQPHPSGPTADSYSALVYGVFDAKNERVQIRVHDNFGDPNAENLKNYGMERAFDVDQLTITDVSVDAQEQIFTRTGSRLLFPAQSCSAAMTVDRSTSATTSATHHRFAGNESWWPASLTRSVPDDALNGSACFQTKFLDRKGATLNQAPALARRNPVLQDESLTIQSPLRNARKIPLVLSYCQNDPGGGSLVSPLFLDYQRFILGIGNAPIDACFAVGREDQFANDLDRILAQKIKEARLTNVDGSDFLFVVAINHRLAPIVTRFHTIIAEKLKNVMAMESQAVSPRVAGVFVYDSQSTDVRPVFTAPGIIACPRTEKDDAASNETQNCSGYRGGKIDLGPVNFLVPIGPFPTLDTFVDYNRQYGDQGRSQNPQLVVRSVQTNPNSTNPLELNGKGGSYTFFDRERLDLSQGQGLKFCADRDREGLLNQLAFRATGRNSDESQILRLNDVKQVLAKNGDPVTLKVGIYWEHPFLGALSYDSPLEGKILDFIPISKTFGNSQKVGDRKWSRSNWSVGRLMQKCLRHCDHPTFDETGTYQPSLKWNSVDACVTPKYPEPTP